MQIEAPPIKRGSDKAAGEHRILGELEHSAEQAREGCERAEATIRAGEHFVRASTACARGAHRPYAPQELIDLADTVTEMNLVKHQDGLRVPAQRGIEG